MKHSVKWMALCIAAAFATPTFSAPVLDAQLTPSSALHQQNQRLVEIDTQAFEQNIATLQSQLQGSQNLRCDESRCLRQWHCSCPASSR